MRKLMQITALATFIVLLNVATLFVLGGGFATSQGGPPLGPPCVAGDANGDGMLDVSDPIYLLGFLFDSG